MITVQTSMSPVFVGTPAGEYGFTNVGTYNFASVSYVSSGTNAPVSTTQLLDGAYIIVDCVGAIEATQGPNIIGAGTIGIALAAGTVGMILAVRWIVRVSMGVAGIPRSGAE